MAKAQKVSGGRRARGSISAEEIIAGAFDVAGRVSLSEFSMPMLAKHLGVGVTSIYWYFRKKDDYGTRKGKDSRAQSCPP